MNLSIILDFPWFRKWELEFIFHIDLLRWCWFDRYWKGGYFRDCQVCKDLGLEAGNGKFFEFDVSILCFTFIVEGLKP